MAVTRPPAAPISWPPKPPPQPLKRIYTVKPRENFAMIARREGINPWTLIHFNFKTADSAEVNWYLKNLLHCTNETHDRKNYIFSGGEQIYVPNVPAGACDGTPFRSSWTANHATAYEQWVQTFGQNYAAKSKYTRDCADFAIDVLVDFARTRQLPVAFFAARHTRLKIAWPDGVICAPTVGQVNIYDSDPASVSDISFSLAVDAPGYDAFAQKARFHILAEHLRDTTSGNTVPISWAQVRAGDLLFAAPPNTGHVQVVVAPTGSIMVGGIAKRVMLIVQGTTYHGNALAGRSPGEPIAFKAWDLVDRTLYYEQVGDKWQEDLDWDGPLATMEPRRWNFSRFNEAYGLRPM